MRTVLDAYGGNSAVLVDEMIGNAYYTVKLVAVNIEYVKHLSAHMPELYRVAQSVTEIEQAAAGYLPVAAAPTEAPTLIVDKAPFIVDTDGTKIWVYINGAWKYASLNGVG